MQAKLFEVRDRSTFLPVLAVQLSGDDGPLAKRAGYGPPLIIMVPLDGLARGRAEYSPYEWGERTLAAAHSYLSRSGEFDRLPSGAVVDVEFILGETPHPKVSECQMTAALSSTSSSVEDFLLTACYFHVFDDEGLRASGEPICAVCGGVKSAAVHDGTLS